MRRAVDYLGSPAAAAPGSVTIPAPVAVPTGSTYVSSNYAMKVTDFFVRVTMKSGSIGITLPDVKRAAGKRYTVLRLDAGNTLTVQSVPGQYLNGASSLTVGAAAYSAYSFVSDGIEWHASAGV